MVFENHKNILDLKARYLNNERIEPLNIIIMPIKAAQLLREHGYIDDKAAIIYILQCYKVNGETNIICDTELWIDFDDFDDKKRINAMTAEHAENIKNFVLSLPKEIQELIVCCPAGISRSPAVAAGILKGLGYSDMHIWRNPRYSPNRLCYKLMLKAFGKSTVLVCFKKSISEHIFRKALKKAKKGKVDCTNI